MKTYKFTVYLIGMGENEDEAWQDAVEGFMLEPGYVPEDQDDIELVEEEID